LSKSKPKISDVVIFKALPIYFGREFKGYFLDKEDFVNILNLLAEREQEHEQEQAETKEP
jgi:hypothetical protein